MESGRSTPVAMSRPASRGLTTEDTVVADLARPPESRRTQQNYGALFPSLNGNERSRTEVFDFASFQSYRTSESNQSCMLQAILDNRTSSMAVIQGSVLTAIGLGWAVYSRIFRFNLESWISKFGQLESDANKDVLSDFTLKGTQQLPPVDQQPRLDTSVQPKTNVNIASPSTPQATPLEVKINRPDDCSSTQSDETQDRKSKTQTLLEKHIAYLEPWVSKQPFSPNEERQTQPQSSESRIDDELRRMSISAFTDLSKAIYRDVRQREQESSPESPNPPQTPGWDGCVRNRENEARMVLCRTINEQYLRLVLALVLELARRIAEIRIGERRRGVVLAS